MVPYQKPDIVPVTNNINHENAISAVHSRRGSRMKSVEKRNGSSPRIHARVKPVMPSRKIAEPPSHISPAPIFCDTTAECAGGMRRSAGIKIPVLKIIDPTRTIAA